MSEYKQRVLNFANFLFQTPEKESEDKNKEATSPTKETPPAGSSRRKQASAQHITKDKDDKEGKPEEEDDDIVEIVEETPR